MLWRKKTAVPTPSYHSCEPLQPPKSILKKDTGGQASNSGLSVDTTHSLDLVSGPSQHSSRDRTFSRNEIMTRRAQPLAPLVTATANAVSRESSLQASVGSQYSPRTGFTHILAPTRKSSRPTSPSTSSFGTWARANNHPHSTERSYGGAVLVCSSQLSALSFPISSGDATPLASYSSSSVTTITPLSPYESVNKLHEMESPRAFPERSPVFKQSKLQVNAEKGERETDVPMLNLIPATPQDRNEGFPVRSKARCSLEELAKINEVTEEVSLNDGAEQIELRAAPQWERECVPTIDLNLDFAPFQPLVNFSRSSAISKDGRNSRTNTKECIEEPYKFKGAEEEPPYPHKQPPSAPLPPPPFQFYHSLQSLASETSTEPISTSASMSSLVSFPDVEEALGSMIASLSESSMASDTLYTPREESFDIGGEYGPDIEPLDSRFAHFTAPLSIFPRREFQSKNRASSSLRLSNSRYDQVESQEVQSAPQLRHYMVRSSDNRVIYSSPPYDIFVPSSEALQVGLAPTPQFSAIPLPISDSQLDIKRNESKRLSKSYRDSCSESGFSDEELSTASIMSVTPLTIQGKIGTRLEQTRKEIAFGGHPLKERTEIEFGLGLGLEIENDNVGLAI
nr:hypothetical protein L204_04592 [Cryptococcus depauperatus CBS 7855]